MKEPLSIHLDDEAGQVVIRALGDDERESSQSARNARIPGFGQRHFSS